MELLMGDVEDPTRVVESLQEAQRLFRELDMIPHAHIALQMLERFYGMPVHDTDHREATPMDFPSPLTRNGHTPLD
jgi:hypothetical protein